MVSYLLIEPKQRPRCQRCRGQLVRSYDDISCLQCGAPHTSEGKLVPTYSAQVLDGHCIYSSFAK